MSKKGGSKVVHSAAEAPADYKFNLGPWNALLIHHRIVGGSTGGRVLISMSGSIGGTYITHHGKGTNIPAGNQATSYTCLVEGLMDYVNVRLERTDGAHTITIQPLNI